MPLHRQVAEQADKLDAEYDLLERMRETSLDSETHVLLMLQQAKRVRRESTHLVRLLAQVRDDLQS